MWAKGDIVKVREQFARPSRIGHTATIYSVRTIGVNKPTPQYLICYDDTKTTDWLDEQDLELVSVLEPVDPEKFPAIEKFKEKYIGEGYHTDGDNKPEPEPPRRVLHL